MSKPAKPHKPVQPLLVLLLAAAAVVVVSLFNVSSGQAQENRPRTTTNTPTILDNPPITNNTDTRPRTVNNSAPNQAATNSALVPENTDEGLVRCGNKSNDPCTVEDIFNVFVILTNYLIGLAGILTVVSIVYAGFSMVLAAGKSEAISAAKKRLTNSIIGLALVALAFLIINAVLYGTLGLGVFGGQNILENPAEYINQK